MSDAVSESTWRHVENGTGKKLRPSTTAAIAAILQWPADALARIAAGEDPASLPTVDPTTEPSEASQLEILGRDLAILRGENAKLAQELSNVAGMLRQLLEREGDPK